MKQTRSVELLVSRGAVLFGGASASFHVFLLDVAGVANANGLAGRKLQEISTQAISDLPDWIALGYRVEMKFEKEDVGNGESD